MIANSNYKDLSLEFWANVKLLNQRLGYTKRQTDKNGNFQFVVPTVNQIIEVFKEEGLNPSKLIEDGNLTSFGQKLIGYYKFRSNALITLVEPNLMNKDQAKELFYKMKKDYKPTCPLPLNKQTGEKKDHAFLTGMVNMIIEKNKGNLPCDYEPMQLTALTENKYPVRTLSRRVDGAFPSVIDPKAIWEIKEYYYTTTFGSRVADGVYETQLDGWELWEASENLNRKVDHYLIIDDHFTWWTLGRSYLCRIIDLLHMGLVTEVLFGKEIITRLPVIVKQWSTLTGYNDTVAIAAEE